MTKRNDSSERRVVAFEGAAPHVRAIIRRVLKLERDQLYSKRPRVVDDVVIVVKEAVARKIAHEEKDRGEE